MTDNELIKEFEIFIKYSAPENLLNDILDLINRQKAEIERLQTENRILSQKRINFFERLEIVNEARVAAVKEFWGKLKQQNTMDARIVSVASGDNLLKEMTGGKT